MTQRARGGATRVKSLAKDAAGLAALASDLGTFGVGGLLVTDDLTVVARCRNRVLISGKLSDPTAHVERQLIDWYYQEKSKGAVLPEPGSLTILSSLEPCMMCAGAILASGFRCVAIAADNFAGVGVERACVHLPNSLTQQGREAFSLFGVGSQESVAPPAPPFNVALPASTYYAANKAFELSLERVRNAVGLAQSIAEFKVAVGADDTVTPKLEVSQRTWTTEKRAFGAYNAAQARALLPRDEELCAVLIDEKGGALTASVGELDKSPIRTAVHEVIRAFAKARVSGSRGALLRHYRPQDLSLVLFGRFSSAAARVSALGAVGSFLENPLPQGRAPFIRVSDSEELDAVRATLANFPPLYTDLIKITVGVWSDPQ